MHFCFLTPQCDLCLTLVDKCVVIWFVGERDNTEALCFQLLDSRDFTQETQTPLKHVNTTHWCLRFCSLSQKKEHQISIVHGLNIWNDAGATVMDLITVLLMEKQLSINGCVWKKLNEFTFKHEVSFVTLVESTKAKQWIEKLYFQVNQI